MSRRGTNVTDEDRKYIIQLRNKGYSISNIAHFSERGESTVRKVLKDEATKTV